MTLPVHRTILLGAAFVVGCGSNQSEVPPELMDAIRTSERNGNTGSEVGDTVENLCFDGWRNPKAAGFDPNRFEKICLYDFADDTSARLLLVNAGAIWCITCRTEYDGSADRPSMHDNLQSRYAQGYRILGTLFQGAQGDPATPDDAVTWAETFDVDFPFAPDPKLQMGSFFTPAAAPFNMLVDLSSMKILNKLEGDEPAVLYSAVDDFLAGGAAQ